MPQFVKVNGIEIERPIPPANPRNCSMAELEDYLHREAHYERQVAAAVDGRQLEVQQEQETDRRYTIPLEQLKAEAEADQKAREDQERDQFRTQNAYTFMAHEPRYKVSPSNAVAIENELNTRKLRGTVNDLKNVFEDLAAQGKLELNNVPPGPKKIYSLAEFQAMAPEEMKDAVSRMHADGIF